jgi:hypothetical protein
VRDLASRVDRKSVVDTACAAWPQAERSRDRQPANVVGLAGAEGDNLQRNVLVETAQGQALTATQTCGVAA